MKRYVKVIDLPRGEGSVLAEGDVETEDRFVLNCTFGSSTLKHGGNDPKGGDIGYFCGGKMDVVVVSDQVKVLFCRNCGLRHQVPSQAITPRHLQD